jgi:hypothetical protein
LLILIGQSNVRIDNQQNKSRLAESRLSLLRDLLLQGVTNLQPTPSVHNVEGHAIPFDLYSLTVSGYTTMLFNNGNAATDKPID